MLMLVYYVNINTLIDFLNILIYIYFVSHNTQRANLCSTSSATFIASKYLLLT